MNNKIKQRSNFESKMSIRKHRIESNRINSITPGGAPEALLEELGQFWLGETLRFVFLVLDKVVAESLVVLVNDHSPNDKQIAPLKNGSGTLFVFVDVLVIQFFVARPMDTSVLVGLLHNKEGRKRKDG